jgi:drug/metabolite transporter (DMT)-like permease
MQPSTRTLGLVLGLIAATMFGASLPATRAAVAGGLDPWFTVAGRAVVGGVLALAMLAVTRPPFPRAHLGKLALISLFLVIGFPAALAIASLTVPSAHGGVILGLLPLATTIAAVALAGERPSLAFWGLSLVGAGLVVAFALRDGSLAVVTGDIYLALAVTLTGIGYTLSGILSRTLPGWEVIAWALALSFPFVAIAMFVLWPANAAAIPASAWIGLAYSGVFAQFVGYALWNMALARGGVARVGQLQLLQPFITLVIAALFLGETIDTEMVVFATAIVIVVALGRRAAIRQRG